ncbi:helix-turn-helix transcriptional regulator [Kutzneria sp. NPDC052558]|uniref:helix-turn-helix transcriptional regulator n=1 Tax=Kutzneria sp. NPDC052558 TaxID=3364121 RepID=UPI0037C7ABF6
MEQVVRELAGLPVAGLTSGELGAAVSAVIKPLVGHDGLRMVGYGPSAHGGLGSFSFVHGYEPDFGRALYHGISVGDDPYPIEVLERQAVPGAVVASGRIFHDYGVGGELRVALRTPRGVWGTIGLLRGEGTKPFSDKDTVAIAELIPGLVDLLRRYVTAAPLVPPGPTPMAGVALLGRDGRIRVATPEARQWLDLLWDDKAGPSWVIEAGLKFLALRARTSPEPPPIVGPAASYGHWVALQAQLLGDEVAIVLQPATGERMLPAFADWYGLTAREREVVARLYGASAPKQIARQLDLSVHTVNEHLKSLYRKTGASSRDELVAALAG